MLEFDLSLNSSLYPNSIRCRRLRCYASWISSFFSYSFLLHEVVLMFLPISPQAQQYTGQLHFQPLSSQRLMTCGRRVQVPLHHLLIVLFFLFFCSGILILRGLLQARSGNPSLIPCRYTDTHLHQNVDLQGDWT